MKQILSVLLMVAATSIAVPPKPAKPAKAVEPSIPAAPTAIPGPVSVPSTYYKPSKEVAWVCPAHKVGLDITTNDVIYVVQSIQTNVAGVYVVSYPTATTATNVPIIIEFLADSYRRKFDLRFGVMKSSDPKAPAAKVVDGINVTLDPDPKVERKPDACVDAGLFFCKDKTQFIFGAITESTLRRRIFGKRSG